MCIRDRRYNVAYRLANRANRKRTDSLIDDDERRKRTDLIVETGVAAMTKIVLAGKDADRPRSDSLLEPVRKAAVTITTTEIAADAV